jgi:hypothetical protein
MLNTSVIIFTFCSSIFSTSYHLLDKPLIFNELVAYPRSPESKFVLVGSEYLNKKVVYFDSAIAINFPVLTIIFTDLQLQMNPQAAAWMLLASKDDAFPLLTQDFVLSVPISFKYKKISGALKYNHISAHLGDGVKKILKDDDILKPFVYSRDFISLILAYDYKVDGIDSRFYTNVGYAHKMYPKHLKRYFIGKGIEFKLVKNNLSPYCANDFTYNADTDSLDYSSQCGMYLSHKKENLFDIKLALTLYIGSDRRGQLLGREMKEFGLGVFVE